MSNLGWYQRMTILAKKVGGPHNLMVITGVAGYIVLRAVEASGKVIVKCVKKKENANVAAIYVVEKEETSNEGLSFKIGDLFKVLERDGDAVLIEKLYDSGNPYFVSAKFLSTISNYHID